MFISIYSVCSINYNNSQYYSNYIILFHVVNKISCKMEKKHRRIRHIIPRVSVLTSQLSFRLYFSCMHLYIATHSLTVMNCKNTLRHHLLNGITSKNLKRAIIKLKIQTFDMIPTAKEILFSRTNNTRFIGNKGLY